MTTDLSNQELLWLAKLESRSLQARPPEHISVRLIALGLVQSRLGGLKRTPAGDELLRAKATD